MDILLPEIGKKIENVTGKKTVERTRIEIETEIVGKTGIGKEIKTERRIRTRNVNERKTVSDDLAANLVTETVNEGHVVSHMKETGRNVLGQGHGIVGVGLDQGKRRENQEAETDVEAEVAVRNVAGVGAAAGTDAVGAEAETVAIVAVEIIGVHEAEVKLLSRSCLLRKGMHELCFACSCHHAFGRETLRISFQLLEKSMMYA